MGLAYDLKKANTSLVERKLVVHGERKSLGPDGKSSYYKNRVDMATEWIGGLISILSPMLMIRWLMAAICS